MKDPHVHAEKTPVPGFGHAAIRSIITEATGLVPSLPKTVGTGCRLRRPIAMISTAPEKITCLVCREWAREEYLTWAGMARAAAKLAEAEPRSAAARRRPPRTTSAPRSALTARFEVIR